MTAREIIEAEDPKQVFHAMPRDEIVLIGYDEAVWRISPRELEQLMAWKMAEPAWLPSEKPTHEYLVPGCFEDSEIELALREIRGT